MSIRIRLTLWYVVVLCLGLAIFAGAVLWQTQQAASAALDQTLARRAQDVSADLRFTPALVLRPDAPDESGRQPGEATLWIRVLNAQGHVVVRQGPPVPGLPAGVLAERQAGFRDEIAGGAPARGVARHVRLFVQAVLSHGRRVATIQIITTTDQLEAARRQLLAAMGVAGGLIVLVATLGGLFLADRALRPVDRITRLAEQIGAGDLHRRVSAAVWGPAAPARRRTDELGRLVHTIDAMLGRLEEAGERRRRLTADAAHELCTPIATISSAAEIALRHPRDAAAYRATLQHIWDESRHMSRVVDDLLLLARADAGRLPMSHDLVEVDEVCRQAVAAFRPLAEARGVSLAATLPAHPLLVLGDEMRLGQVVRNLLDNALRYTPAGGAVRLTLQSGPDDGRAGHDVIIRVSDTGSGIPPHEQDRIFERFHRAATATPSTAGTSRRAGGSGLGLAICKAIVHAHGGQIRVESGGPGPREGCAQGAHFVVVLPGVAEDTTP